MLVKLFLGFLEDFFRDDLRDNVVEDVFAISGDSCVFLIPQQPGNGVCLPHLAFAKNALFVERENDVFDLLVVDDGCENPFDDFRLVFVDDVSFVLVYAVSVDNRLAREFSLGPGLVIATDDFLSEFLGIIFAIPFKDGFKNNSFGGIADVLGSGNDPYPVIPQLLLIDRGIVSVPREPIEFLDQHILKGLV